MTAVGVGLAAGVLIFLVPRAGMTPPSIPTASSARPALHTLRIESLPPGATISEGASVLGHTPLSLPVDPTAGTRHVVLSLDGYMPYAVDQPSLTEDV